MKKTDLDTSSAPPEPSDASDPEPFCPKRVEKEVLAKKIRPGGARCLEA